MTMSNENTEPKRKALHDVPEESTEITKMVLKLFEVMGVPYEVAMGSAYQLLGNVLVVSSGSLEEAMANADNIAASLKLNIPEAYAAKVEVEAAEDQATETV
jgi:hypothetical protein